MPSSLNPSIHIVDYGLGNLGSILNMFRRLGIRTVLTSNPEEVKRAERLLLPGVGAFDCGMRNLQERGLLEVLNEKSRIEKVPTLGICLGMQLLTQSSEEGTENGLGWIKGHTVDMRRFALPEENLKFPHIGWNYINVVNDHFLCRNMPEDPRFYFVHGYMVSCESPNNIISTTNYGSLSLVSMCHEGNVAGAQFHPEKSHKFGMQLLKNFSEWEPQR